MTGVEQDRDEAYRHPDPAVDAALTWFATLQDGPADPPTRAAFEAWRAADPRHAAAWDRVAAVGAMPELRAATRRLADAPAAGAMRRATPQARVQRVGVQRVRVWWGSLAAAAVLAAIGLHLAPTLAVRWSADHLTATGERRTVTLPDGSQLLLDTASAVAVDFAGDRRDVRLLRGDAFFDVVPDPDRPFRVAAAHSRVEVTGTAFAVHTGDGADAVVLERGRVTVRRADGKGDPVALVPGQGVTADDGGLSPAAPADLAVALAWRDGRYVFHDQPLAAVVEALGRYHDGPILVLDDRVERERVSGSYRTDAPLDALRALAGIAGVRITVLPGGIVLLG